MFEINVKQVPAPVGIKRLRLVRNGFNHGGDVRIRFHNHFICVGDDISIHVLLTGGRI